MICQVIEDHGQNMITPVIATITILLTILVKIPITEVIMMNVTKEIVIDIIKMIGQGQVSVIHSVDPEIIPIHTAGIHFPNQITHHLVTPPTHILNRTIPMPHQSHHHLCIRRLVPILGPTT